VFFKARGALAAQAGIHSSSFLMYHSVPIEQRITYRPLFERDKSVISRHLRKVFADGELERSSVVARNATTTEESSVVQDEGERTVHRTVRFYNLDVVISVGYRVNSKRGTQFRIWATNVLREHLLKGYTVNERRLQELNQAVRLVADVANRRELTGDEATALLHVVGEYSFALDLLDDYDYQRVVAPATGTTVIHALKYNEAVRIVKHLRGRFGSSELPCTMHLANAGSRTPPSWLRHC
jgi:hypothetical protein